MPDIDTPAVYQPGLIPSQRGMINPQQQQQPFFVPRTPDGVLNRLPTGVRNRSGQSKEHLKISQYKNISFDHLYRFNRCRDQL
jgi:hypothetical protein